MTVAAQTQKISKNASFEIKSSQLSILVFRLRSFDLHLVSSEMDAQFTDSPDFFDGEPVLIDLYELPGQSDPTFQIDFGAIIDMLSRYGLKAVGVRGVPSSARDLVRSSGLFLDEGSIEPAFSPSQAAEPPEPVVTPDAAAFEVVNIDIDRGAMVIDKPLRSGQQVYARGRDLVVLSMVNPGAEVIADGHIHVYAPLRGKAMAGAAGDIRARIFAGSLEAELLSIAGIWQTSEALQKDPAWGGSAQVRLVLDDAAPEASDSSAQSTQTSPNRARLVISRLGD